MIRWLRRFVSAEARSRRVLRPAFHGAIALSVFIGFVLVSACETMEEAPPPPPAEEVFESPQPSAPIQEESLGPPPAPTPPSLAAPGVTAPGEVGTYPPAAVPYAPPPGTRLPPPDNEGSPGGQRRFPLSSPGAAPAGSAPIQNAPPE